MKELWEQQYYDDAAQEITFAEAELVKTRAAEAEARLILEREWAARHPAEWAEWVRILPLLAFSYDFATGETYDFPQFLSEVGSRPSANHVIQRRDDTLPYGQGNLVWMKQRTTSADLRPVDSPYLTVDEAAACRTSIPAGSFRGCSSR